LKCPSGKNDRPQHGPAALLGDTQPGDHLSGGEPLLLNRIDLPDLMHLAGTSLLTIAAGPSRRRRLQPFPLQPPLQRAFAGKRLCGEQGLQFQSNSSGSPAGMLLAERQRPPVQSPVSVGGLAAAGLVAGRERLRALGSQAPQQVSHSPRFQLQLRGDLCG